MMFYSESVVVSIACAMECKFAHLVAVDTTDSYVDAETTLRVKVAQVSRRRHSSCFSYV